MVPIILAASLFKSFCRALTSFVFAESGTPFWDSWSETSDVICPKSVVKLSLRTESGITVWIVSFFTAAATNSFWLVERLPVFPSEAAVI